jgi:anti-sigma factor ChrR (cupin superfamily)
MSAADNNGRCDCTELVSLYALDALPSGEAAAMKTHIGECGACQRELERLRPMVNSFVVWPTDVLRPSASLQERLAQRIAEETGGEPVLPPLPEYKEPDWEEVAPGIFTKILATDTERDRVTMLVRLLPGVSYPPHTHAGVEELHLLDGELWIEDRLLYPGDYNYGKPGASDQRVYSETGCTCVLITSPSDVLR